jgi:RND family efflux transporter MFP subunit
MKNRVPVLIAGLVWPLATAFAQQPLGCLIEPFRISDVGSPVIGVIEQTLVERGDRVSVGQPLATLLASVERQSVAVAESKAQGIGELKAAEATAELARQKLARTQHLVDQQFISIQALDQAKADALVAQNRLQQAREQRDIYAREHALAKSQLELRTIRSPISGVVAERFLSPGERVEEKAIFRVAVVNPLRVEVVLPSTYYAVVKQGMSVSVTPEFPGASARLARVTVVDRLVDGASNTFRIRLELPNADLSLPAGLRCKADLGPVAAPAKPRPLQPAPTPASGRMGAPSRGQLAPVPALQPPRS